LHVVKGGGASVTVDIPAKRFRYWDTAKKQYTVEAGKYELLVGAASDDIRARVPFVIERE
jgi:beta-glucosidase